VLLNRFDIIVEGRAENTWLHELAKQTAIRPSGGAVEPL
jgi:hypothetical protein